MIDTEKIRLRIRHFLLQQSVLFSRAVSQNNEKNPSVKAMAEELSKKTQLTSRRIQKYLAIEIPPKDLSINLTDIAEFAALKNLNLGEFMGYLLKEDNTTTLKSQDKVLIDEFNRLHEGHRRALKATIFSSKNQIKTEQILDICLKMYPLEEKDRKILEDIVEVFFEKYKLKGK